MRPIQFDRLIFGQSPVYILESEKPLVAGTLEISLPFRFTRMFQSPYEVAFVATPDYNKCLIFGRLQPQ